ncbi:MAG: DUF3106 domain-containing protein [Rhodoferax sp.]
MQTMQQAPVRKLNPLATGAAIFAAAFLLVLGILRFVPADWRYISTAAPVPAAVPAVAVAQLPAAAASHAATVAKAPTRANKTTGKSKVRKAPRGPWNELTAAQQEALQPLASEWDTMSLGQRRKWLALSKNFPSMPLDEQAKLFSRMTEWAALSTQQRIQARLNFAETEQLSSEEKRNKWQAYQALSPEERQKLEATAPPKIRGAALAVRPKPHRKMTAPHPIRPNPDSTPKSPGKSAAAQRQVNLNTLLPGTPQEAMSPAAIPAAVAAPAPALAPAVPVAR